MKKLNVKVSNFEGNNGPVKNQFIIQYYGNRTKVIFFQSYNSIIAKKENGKITLDENKWDYSKTTGKYRNIFLGETKKETEKKIKSGEYKLENLN